MSLLNKKTVDDINAKGKRVLVQKVPASLEAGTFFSCEEGFEGRAVQSNSPALSII